MNTAPYLEQLQKLVELQKVDDQIHAVRQKLEGAPRELENLEEKFSTLTGKRNHVLDKLTHLQEQQKRLNAEIDEDSSRIKKSKNKLMQVANSREHQAMLREMDNMEKSYRNREAEKATLYEELQIQNEALADLDTEYNALKAELDGMRANLEPTLQEANNELAELKIKRQNASRSIRPEIFMRYEFIRNRLDHPVIVAVEDGICSGCHIAIPPQKYIELQMGQQILDCPNCQRLIYWKKHFEIPEEKPAEAEEKKEAKPENATYAMEAEKPEDSAENQETASE